jgi:hypothetical protein
MEALTHPGGDRDVSAPGEHETWQELAEHSVEHDQLSTALPDPAAYARFTAAARRRAGRAASYVSWLHGQPGAG